MTVLRAGAATDVGLVRANNQDTLLLGDTLYAVADGMGGHAGGEVASDTAVKALGAAWAAAAIDEPEALVDAARHANRQVWETAQASPGLRGMGTTLVAVALTGEGGGSEGLAVVSVGDSRVYLLRGGDLEQLTVDHSLVAELVAEGRIPAEEAEFHPQRHVLTRALGVDPDVHVDLFTLAPRPGDRLLLCSDGLIRDVDDSLVASLLRRLEDPDEAARELVAEARLRGGSDNITVVVLDVVADLPGTADGHGAGTPDVEAGDGARRVPGATATELDDAGPGAGDTTVLAASAPLNGAPRSRRWPRSGRAAGRRTADGRPRARVVTPRVVAFVAALALVVGGAAAGVGWYARSGYYVALTGGQLVVYKGRPGGVLWFKPTVTERTGVTTAQVEPRHLAELQAGVTESSLAAARTYVGNLTGELASAQRAATPSTAPSPAAAPSTTAPSTSTPGPTAQAPAGQAGTTSPAPTPGAP